MTSVLGRVLSEFSLSEQRSHMENLLAHAIATHTRPEGDQETQLFQIVFEKENARAPKAFIAWSMIAVSQGLVACVGEIHSYATTTSVSDFVPRLSGDQSGDSVSSLNLKNCEALLAQFPGIYFQFEGRFVRFDGEIRWIRVTGKYNERAGENKVFNGNIQDVTINKRESLLFEKTESAAQIGGWEWDYINKRAFLSHGIFSILDLKSYSIEPTLELLLQYFVEGDRKKFFDEMKAAIEQGGSFHADYRMRSATGRFKVIRVEGRVDQVYGKVIKAYGSCQDITDSTRQKEVLKLITENTQDVVALFEANSRLVYISPSVRDLLGFLPAEMVGKSSFDFVYNEDREALQKHVTERQQTLVYTHPVETRLARKDGSPVWVEIVSKPIFDEHGSLRHLQSSLRDITQRKNLEESNRVAQLKLVQSSKMSALGEMSSGVAHEINNPLAIIVAKAAQLRKLSQKGEVSVERVSETSLKIEKMADRIAKIIRGLRMISRDGEGDPFETRPLRELVDDTLELCRSRMMTCGVSFEVSEVPDVQLDCRVVQISQVLLNLLNNSIDAISERGDKWLKLDIKVEDEVIEFRVTDSGEGIAPEVARKIMQPFYTTKDVGKGTGLGLSLSKGIVENHGGAIMLDDTCPNTCFVVRIPQYQIMLERDFSLVG